MKIFEEVVTVKFRGSFTRPLHSSTRTSCTGMPAYLDKKYLSKDIRQYNDGRVRCRVSGTNGLEVILEGWICFDIQEDRSFADKICWARRFRVQVSCKS